MSSSSKVAIIVGASSGLGAALARGLARKGWRLGLVARRQDELEKVADSLNRRRANTARVYAHDVTRLDEAAALFQRITHEMGGFDLIIYSAGVMPSVAADEYNIAKDELVFGVNVLGAMAWLNEAAMRCEAQRCGTIVGISSVAGERGRKGQPVYCASKAALNTYLEGLRNRLGHKGIKVITIKPGPMKTPMTEGMKLPFMISADEGARQIIAVIEKRRNGAYVPRIWCPIMAVIRNIPSIFLRGKDI